MFDYSPDKSSADEKLDQLLESNNRILKEVVKEKRIVEASRMSDTHYRSFYFGSFSFSNEELQAASSNTKFDSIQTIISTYTDKIIEKRERYSVEKNVQNLMRETLPLIVSAFFDPDEGIECSKELKYTVNKLSTYTINGKADEVIEFNTVFLFPFEDKNIEIDLTNPHSRKPWVSQSCSAVIATTEQILGGYRFVPDYLFGVLQNGRHWLLLKQSVNTDGSFTYQFTERVAVTIDENNLKKLDGVSLVAQWIIICLENVRAVVVKMREESLGLSSRVAHMRITDEKDRREEKEDSAKDSDNDENRGASKGSKGFSRSKKSSDTKTASGHKHSQTSLQLSAFNNKTTKFSLGNEKKGLSETMLRYHDSIMNRTTTYY